MNLMWWLYLVNTVENLHWFFFLITIISLVIFVGTLIGGTEASNGFPWKAWRRWFYGSGALCAIAMFLSIITPSEKTMYLMLGSEAAQEIANNPAVKEVGGRLLKVVNKKLDELMPDEEKKSEEKKK